MATNLVARYLALKPVEIEDYTRESIEWFKDNLRQIRLTETGRKNLLAEGRKVANMEEGKIHMFFYDAKHKEKLPYYDRFPLIITLDRQPTHFTGLNLHYLAPRMRVEFLNRIDEFMSDRNMDENTKFRLKYEVLDGIRRLRFFKPCFKQYLYSNVQSKIVEVPIDKWELISMLPSQMFTVNANTVYSDSRKIIEAM